jgi:beta-lactamase class A
MRTAIKSAFRFLALLLIAQPLVLAQQPDRTAERAGSDSAFKNLEREIARLAVRAGGRLGVSAVHIETGWRVAFNGDERFPMASTFKLPVAVQLLARVDGGEVSLGDLVKIKKTDLRPLRQAPKEFLSQADVELSVRSLLESMLVISDNAATDIVVRIAGGPSSVTARLRSLGIEGINVDRPTVFQLADYEGVAKLPPEHEWSPDILELLSANVSVEERRLAAKKFYEDPRDTATPIAMTTLLERIQRREISKPASAEILIDIMLRCKTGGARIKGLLPFGTPVAHKTGTLGAITNDVGIITLPGKAGHIAIAVFITSSDENTRRSEQVIAEIARAVYEFHQAR